MNTALVILNLLVLMTLTWAEESPIRPGSPLSQIAPGRIEDLMARQPPGPVGVGKPIGDRAYWSDPARIQMARSFRSKAERIAREGFPEWSDDIYLEFSRTGLRKRAEDMFRGRDRSLKPLVLMECVEDQGRFLPVLHRLIESLLAQPSWVWPAHDRDLAVFHQRKYEVDLNCASFGADLAQALYLLGDRLDPALRDRMRAEILRRLVHPVLESYRTGEGHFWMTVRMNWNAVCLAGTTSAALIVLDDPRARAEMMACAEHLINYSFLGYRDDGYNDEGGGYQNYGFGNLLSLRERLLAGSGGSIDLFHDPRAAKAARFSLDYVLTDDLMPTFADSAPNAKVNPVLASALRRVFREAPPDAAAGIGERLSICLQMPTPLPTTDLPPAAPAKELRSYWESVGVLVARPKPGTASTLAVAIKNGGNGNHSHNDVGSWCLTLGGMLVAGDPGGPRVYRADTFGPERYTRYRMLNSYGHPVPIIDGQLQRTATEVTTQVLATDFSDAMDRLSLDLTAAYKVSALQRYERTLTYDRQGEGSVRIDDAFVATTPIPLEMGFTHYGTSTFTAPDRLVIQVEGRALEVMVEGPAYEVVQEQISEMDSPPFHRIGFRLREPVQQARFSITMRPLPREGSTPPKAGE